jgi:hypothetical protein
MSNSETKIKTEESMFNNSWNIALGIVIAFIVLGLASFLYRHHKNCKHVMVTEENAVLTTNANGNPEIVNVAVEENGEIAGAHKSNNNNITVVEGKIEATYLATNLPFSSANNGNNSGEYKFTLMDPDGHPVKHDVEYAYSIASSSKDTSCLHISAENHSEFTYTKKDVFSVADGTLCVSAIGRDAQGNVVVYANGSFDIVSAPIAAPEKKSRKNGLFDLLRGKKKKASTAASAHKPTPKTEEPVAPVASVDAIVMITEIPADAVTTHGKALTESNVENVAAIVQSNDSMNGNNTAMNGNNGDGIVAIIVENNNNQ